MSTTTTTTIATINNVSEIANGKCQWNVKTAKDFRTIIAKYCDARKNIADKVKVIAQSVELYEKIINDGNAEIFAIGEGTYKGHRTIDEIKSDIAMAKSKHEPKMEELRVYKEQETKRLEDAQNLITDDLYKGYKSFCDEDKLDAFYVSCANWLAQNGITPCLETVESLCALVGAKDNGNGKIVKSDRLQSAKTKTQFTKSFLNALSDKLANENIIAPHKYEFKFVKKEKATDK